MDELTVTITHHERSDGGEYRAHPAGSPSTGRMTWRWHGDARVVDHTIVPPEFRNQGVAARLVEAIVADARAEGFKIIPECSYVVAAFQQHPEWADLRAEY